jgi:hypothetical protein
MDARFYTPLISFDKTKSVYFSITTFPCHKFIMNNNAAEKIMNRDKLN